MIFETQNRRAEGKPDKNLPFPGLA